MLNGNSIYVGSRTRKILLFVGAFAFYHMAFYTITTRDTVLLLRNDNVLNTNGNQSIPIIYVITPTASLVTQKAHLIRMSQTLSLVPSILWIVVEDSPSKTNLVANVLAKSKVPYVHLWKSVVYNVSHYKGCAQRNLAISWLRHINAQRKIPMDDSPSIIRTYDDENNINYSDSIDMIQNDNKIMLGKSLHTKDTSLIGDIDGVGGVVYFADDDNTYDLEVFEEMRSVKKVGIWPVGFCGGIYVERPKVVNGKVVGWLVAYDPGRAMATDMAGFAINLRLIIEKSDAYFYEVPNANGLESGFVKQFATLDELEPLADNCTKVMVWHTRTAPPILIYENFYLKLYNFSSRDGLEL